VGMQGCVSDVHVRKRIGGACCTVAGTKVSTDEPVAMKTVWKNVIEHITLDSRYAYLIFVVFERKREET
jgi:hypothetical protein